MEIGKYKQAMSYLLNPNATLKTFVINPEAKLTDRNPPSLIETFANGGRVGFKKGTKITGSGIPGVSYSNPSVLKIAENKLKKSVELKNNFNVLNWDEKTTHPELIKEFKKNKIKLTNREYLNKIITEVSKKNNWTDPVQYKREIIVDSFMKHLNTVGEFDGKEKLAEELKPFLGKQGHLYENINKVFKDWTQGKFEVESVDRTLLDKNIKKELKDWSPTQLNVRSLQREKQLEFLNDLNNKDIFLDNAKKQFSKRFNYLEDPLKTFSQRVGQLTTLKLEGKIPSNKDATEFKTYKNIETGERAPWLKQGLTDIYNGNYSKLIKAADELETTGKTKEAERLYNAAEKFFSPNSGIFTKEGGQAEHPFSRVWGGVDQQLKINSLVSGDLNSFKRLNFDEPVIQSISKYRAATTDKERQQLQKSIELRKNFMNYLTGSKEFGGITDPVEFKFTPTDVEVKTNVTPIDKIKDFDVDVFKQRGQAYGEAASEIGKDLGLLTKQGELINRKVSLDRIEEILDKANVTRREREIFNSISNRLNLGFDPNSIKELYPEEFNIAKNVVNKIGTLGLGTLRGLEDVFVSFGRSPAGRVLGVGLLVPEGIHSVGAGLRGDYREMGRIVPNILSFGLYPESLKIPYLNTDIGKGSTDLDLIKHAKEKGFNTDAIKRFLDKNELSKKINDAEDLLKMGSTNENFIKSVEDRRKSLYDEYDNIKLNRADIENFKNTFKSFTEKNYQQAPFVDKKDIPTKTLDFLNEYLQGLDTDFIQENKINIDQKKSNPYIIEDLTDYDRISAADGGRVKLADGSRPKMGRRGFLGLLAGTAALPKLIEELRIGKIAPEVKALRAAKLIPKVSGMPEWFPSLVAKIEKEGKYLGKDTGLVDNLRIKELTIQSKTEKGASEVYTMTEYPDGKIEIHANIKGGAYGQPFELHYTPPKTDIHVETGEPIKYPGDFSIVEQRPRPDPNDPGRWEFDWEDVSKEEAISDIDRVEQVTTGKIANQKAAQRRAAQRKNYDNTPYEDISNRYPDPDVPDYWEVE